jgi:hypothetical protein
MKHTAQIEEGLLPENETAPLVLSPDPFINEQLIRGFTGIAEKFLAKQMSQVGKHHPDIYNALSRLCQRADYKVFSETLTNLFDYFNANNAGHCNILNILVNVTSSGLTKEQQNEYIAIVSLIYALRNPKTRGGMAKSMTWANLSSSVGSATAKELVPKLKRYFNIM